jgi:type IV pilus assembly protein PilE
MRRAIVPRGFTLVELAVALLVVGILASIAYPSYLQYTRRANRGDATRSIMFTAQQLERCYSQTYSYLGCANVTYGAGPSPNNYYTITTVAVAAPNGYTISAVPNGKPQNGDGQCTSFSLASSGVQTSAGSGTVQQCWGSS